MQSWISNPKYLFGWETIFIETINDLSSYLERNALLDLGKMFPGFILLLNRKCNLNLPRQRLILSIPYSATVPRNMLGYLLLWRKQRENNHAVQSVCAVLSFDRIKPDFRSAHEIIGAEAVACHASTTRKSKYFISTCKYRSVQGASPLRLMQRWFRVEPWNQNARYLLVLNLLQKARQASYPQHLMNVLKRMTSAALTNHLFLNNTCERYKRFQLLLCSSELSLLGGDLSSCVSLARDSAKLLLSDTYMFFAHLQLCRAHAAQNDHTSLEKEFTQCLKLKTNYPIGWISLKIIESHHRPQSGSTFSDSGFRDSIKESKKSENSWLAVYCLFCGLIFQRDQDFLRAEEFMAKACSLTATESCFFLCHGAICMELAKKQCDSQYLSMCIRSLKKAQEISSLHLPFVSLLLAQAEASLGSKLNWDRNLRIEWYSWLPEMRPAELYFQMHLLAQRSETTTPGPNNRDSSSWVLRAIHLNPSCPRYWRVLQKLVV